MLLFSNSDRVFIQNNIPDAINILNADKCRDALVLFSRWIDTNTACWDDSGLNYSDFGRKAQRVYDNILENNM